MNTKPAIIVQDLKHEEIVKLIKSIDATTAPMGAGGYEVRSITEKDTTLIKLTPCDCAPAQPVAMMVKGNVIFSKHALDVAFNVLERKRAVFSYNPEYEVPKGLDDFFQKNRGKL